MNAPRDVVEHMRARCTAAGYDLVAAFNTAWWTAEPALPELRPGALGVMVGNTRALWRHVRDQCTSTDPGRPAHPLDRHTEEVITAAAEGAGARYAVVWAHHVSPAFPVQRLAAAIGLATVSPSHLAVHPDHGPWWALRAAVVFDAAGPTERPSPIDVCGPCDKPCLAPFERARAQGEHSDWRAWLAVRDACPVAKASRYAADQIAYHYQTAFGARGSR